MSLATCKYVDIEIGLEVRNQLTCVTCRGEIATARVEKLAVGIYE